MESGNNFRCGGRGNPSVPSIVGAVTEQNMKLSNQSEVPVYTISGSNTARPLPEWLARRRKRSLKNDPEYANRIELLQDFEFEEASQCIRVSEDGEWVMSTGRFYLVKSMLFSLSLATDYGVVKEHTSLKFILTTFPNCLYLGRGIQMRSIRRSSFCPLITQSRSICNPIVRSSSIHPQAAITGRGFPDMVAIWFTTGSRLRL